MQNEGLSVPLITDTDRCFRGKDQINWMKLTRNFEVNTVI